MIRVIYLTFYGLVTPYAYIKRDQRGKGVLPDGTKSLPSIIKSVTWHLPESSFTGRERELYPVRVVVNYTFKIIDKSTRGQCVDHIFHCCFIASGCPVAMMLPSRISLNWAATSSHQP